MPTEKERVYSIWTSMKARCSNENDKDYSRYGGRGISVCQRWRDSFEDFSKDMGPRKSGETVERLNNDGNYEPKNCKWVDRATQSRNRNHAKADNQLNLFAATHEFDAEIFSTGKWNGDTYSESDLQDIVSNYNALAEAVKPPVKLGHAWKEGQPALGWVKKLKLAGNKIVATLTDVPQIVYDAIKAGRYKRVSSEIYWNYKSKAGKTYNYVLKAVALLGADIPAVSDLNDLTAYLSQITANDGTFDRVASYELEVGDDFKIITPKAKPTKEHDMDAKETKVFQDKIDAAEAKAKAAEEKAKADADKLKKFEEQQVKDRQEARIKAFTDECEVLVKAGKMTPAERDGLVKDIPTFKYTDDGFLVPFISLKEFAETRAILDTGEHGESGTGEGKTKEYTGASDELADRAKKYSVENKVDYEVAAKAILEQDSDLAERYKMDDA